MWKTFDIVGSCAEDGRSLGREISTRTRETAPDPEIRICLEFKKNGRQAGRLSIGLIQVINIFTGFINPLSNACRVQSGNRR